MSGSVYTRLAIELSEMHAGMTKARGAVSAYKQHAEKEGGGIGKALFSGIGEQGGEVFKSLFGGAAGAFGVSAGLLGLFKGMEHATGAFRDLDLLGEKLGESTDALQRIAPVARVTKTDLSSLGNALLRLEKAMGQPGNEELTETFARLGLSASELAGMPIDEKLLKLSVAFQKARAEGTGVSDLAKLMGRGFTELIPILSRNTEELERMMGAVRPLSAEFVAEMAGINEAIETAQAKLSKLGKKSLGSVAGTIAFVIDAAKEGSFERAFEHIGERNQAIGLREARKEADHASASENLRIAQEAAAAAKEEEEARKSIERATAASAGHLSRIHRAALDAMLEADRIPALQGDLGGVFEEMQKAGGSFYGANLAGLNQWAEAVKGRMEEAAKAGDLTEQGRWSELYVKILEMLDRAGKISGEIDKVTAALREKAANSAQEIDKMKKEREKKAEKIEREIDELTPKDRPQPGALGRSLNWLGGRSTGDLQLDETRKQTARLVELKTLLREIRDKKSPDTVINVDGVPRF